MSEWDGPGTKVFFLLGFKGERSPGASVLRRRGVGDARDCPRGPSEAFRDDVGAFRRPDGLHRAVPGRLRLRHFSRVPVTSFLLIPVRSLTRIPPFAPTVPPIPHRRPPRADRGPAGAPNLPHEALVPRRHPREVEVLVRARHTSSPRRTRRAKNDTREGERTRRMSFVDAVAEVSRGVYARPNARGGRARRSYPRGHLPTPREYTRKRVREACFKGFAMISRGARGGARSRPPPSPPERSSVARTRRERVSNTSLTVRETHPPSHTAPPSSAGTSCLA